MITAFFVYFALLFCLLFHLLCLRVTRKALQWRCLLCDWMFQLHAVHWNEDLYSCYEDAAKSNEGIMILAVFLKVCIL